MVLVFIVGMLCGIVAMLVIDYAFLVEGDGDELECKQIELRTAAALVNR